MNWIKENIGYIVCFFFGVLLTSLLWILQTNKELEQQIIEVEKPIVKVETITKVDTITVEKIVTKPIHITETVIKTDTIKADTVLEYISKRYVEEVNTDSINGTIEATVSGYSVNLDSLNYRFNIPTFTHSTQVETTITKYKQKHWNFTVGIGAGYGLINRTPDIFVGGTFGYSF